MNDNEELVNIARTVLAEIRIGVFVIWATLMLILIFVGIGHAHGQNIAVLGPQQNITIAFAGHSWANQAYLRSAGCANGQTNLCDWPAGIQVEYMLTHPGATCQQLQDSLADDLSTLATPPDVFVVFDGTNDVIANVYKQPTQWVPELESCLIRYKQSIQSAYPNAQVIMANIPPMAPITKLVIGDTRAAIAEINADVSSWGYADIYSPLADRTGWARLAYMPYGVHIVGDGGWKAIVPSIVNLLGPALRRAVGEK